LPEKPETLIPILVDEPVDRPLSYLDVRLHRNRSINGAAGGK
jgi:hypothetical protein